MWRRVTSPATLQKLYKIVSFCGIQMQCNTSDMWPHFFIPIEPMHSKIPPHRIQNANIQGRSPSIQMYSLKLRRLKYTVLEKAECGAKRRRAARASGLRIALSSACNLGRWCLWLRIRPEHRGYGFSTCFCLWNTRYSLYHTWFFHKSWVQFCRN